MAIDINELQALLNHANAAAANEKAIRKGLARIENLVNNINKEVANVYALLGTGIPASKTRTARALKEAVEVDGEAPYGRKKDGTPKAKAGRNKTSGGTQ